MENDGNISDILDEKYIKVYFQQDAPVGETEKPYAFAGIATFQNGKLEMTFDKDVHVPPFDTLFIDPMQIEDIPDNDSN